MPYKLVSSDTGMLSFPLLGRTAAMSTAQEIPGALWDTDNTQVSQDIFVQKGQVPRTAHRWSEEGEILASPSSQMEFRISPVLLNHKKLLLNVDHQTISRLRDGNASHLLSKVWNMSFRMAYRIYHIKS